MGYNNIIMKKILTFLILFFTICTGISFADVIPRYSYNIKHPGIGAFNPPKEFTIYEKPNENSNVIKTIKWDENGLTNEKIKENDLFIVFLPNKNIAYCSVDDEIDGWVKIFYSQADGKSGWVKTTPHNRFVSWLGFYMSWGRKNGVYFFKDMPDINKRILSGPGAENQKISGYTYPKFVKLTLIRGNWMLIKMLDFGNEVRVGWMQWRDENGKLMIFPIMNSL